MRDEVTVLVDEKYNLMLRKFFSFFGEPRTCLPPGSLHEWVRMIFATGTVG
jgi:hypothetical protein